MLWKARRGWQARGEAIAQELQCASCGMKGSFSATRGHPLSFQAQVRAQDGSLSSTPRPYWVYVMGCLSPPSLGVTAPSSSPGRRDSSAVPAKARLPGEGKGGDEKGRQEHRPGYPSRTAQ